MKEIKCNYKKCYAGMGVAGSSYCFLGGDIFKENCKKFKDGDSENLRQANNKIDELEKQNEEFIVILSNIYNNVSSLRPIIEPVLNLIQKSKLLKQKQIEENLKEG